MTTASCAAASELFLRFEVGVCPLLRFIRPACAGAVAAAALAASSVAGGPATDLG
jgi:hypothetical protein